MDDSHCQAKIEDENVMYAIMYVLQDCERIMNYSNKFFKENSSRRLRIVVICYIAILSTYIMLCCVYVLIWSKQKTVDKVQSPDKVIWIIGYKSFDPGQTIWHNEYNSYYNKVTSYTLHTTILTRSRS